MAPQQRYESKFSALQEVQPARPAQGERPAAGPVYQASYVDPNQDTGVVQGCSTLLETFERSVGLYGDRPCLGHRPIGPDGKVGPFVFTTYAETSAIVSNVAAAYQHMGLVAKDTVGIIGSNCPEWMSAMLAMNKCSIVCVPLYDTLGDKAVEYIVNHAETKLIVASGKKLATLAPALETTKSIVTKGVVYWGKPDTEAIERIKALGLAVRSWDQLVAEGADATGLPAPTAPKPADLCTIMYTSGTTGNPKGVMISHRAVVATIGGILRYLDFLGEKMGPNDAYLSYLPLAHIFDRVVEELMLSFGGSIGFYQGDPRKIMDDVGALRPTLFAGVPRVFERVHSGVQAQVQGGGFLKRLIFKYCFHRKKFYMKRGVKYDRASKLSDMLVFNKIKQKLGGRVRVVVSGGAPLSPAVEEFLRVAMCAPVVQGYGLTETCAASLIANPWRFDHVGTVGMPLCHTMLRLEEVKELNYSPTDEQPAGEVCLKGDGVFTAYYKDEEKTKESVDADGFFHTGDIGRLEADGTVRIVDRMKNIFKLSHGEYIAVEVLEGIYKQADGVEQVWVYGNSQEAYLVAVCVPTEEAAKEWASKNGRSGGSLEELCGVKGFVDHMLASLQAAGKAEKVKGFEMIKALHLEAEPFSAENDLMTPTFKLKRPQLAKRYKKQIDDMYKELNRK